MSGRRDQRGPADRLRARVIRGLIALLGMAPAARADELPRPVGDFATTIRPLVTHRCGNCHGGERRVAQLKLTTAAGVSWGGESGPIIVPGEPDESLLWQRVSSGEMPPGEPLPAEEQDILRAWIAGGAPGLPPRESLGPGGDHWAFAPPVAPLLPEVHATHQVQTPVDRFILARLEAVGLELSPPAERATLARRIALDLCGLPPEPAEVDSFVADNSPEAVARWIDRLLASPQYGVRWGKYWLDAAGYADSNGYFNADSDRPLAWRYRDYVVRAHNADLPWDRFVSEQLAGDELVGYIAGGDVSPEMVDPLVATHFLRNAPDGTGESDGNDDEVLADRFAVLEGTVHIVGSALLGLTVQCARCHDHKFEPLSQAEYYALQAVFWPVYCPDQWRKPAERTVAVGTFAEREAHAARTRELDEAVATLKQAWEARQAACRDELRRERLAALGAELAAAIDSALATAEDARTDEQKQFLAAHAATVEISDEALAERFPELIGARKTTDGEVARLEAERPPPLAALAVVTDTVAEAPPHHLRVRGLYRELGEVVEPAAPATLGGVVFTRDPAANRPATSSGRRLAFARWLTAPENPVLARLIVNRVWQQHFGTGLVATADNLGYTGEPASHPELLDYLAAEFVAHGWSLKWLHRLLLNSAVYQQSSAPRAEAAARDPQNRLWVRFPLRRLDAEALRDSLLWVSGELDATLEGPPVPTARDATGAVDAAPAEPGANRRALYLEQRRTEVASFLEIFDAPSLVTNCTRRTSSTVPLQSLALLNSSFVRSRAEAWAARLAVDESSHDDARLAAIFRRAWGRAPTPEEANTARAFVAAGRTGADPPSPESWVDLCQMALAANAFLYVE